ncbi:MAG TPA: hypothetical protein VMZ33_03470, partial [Candidatus Limnocylindrales bacterium]|nr:hypothetical protein [Candidatus Limnocylindrales bacterium]
GLAVQVFLIGFGMRELGNSPDAISLHRNFGYLLHLSVLGVLLFAYLSRAGRRHWLWALALTVVVLIFPLLVPLRSTYPVLAALHPVGAAVAFALATIVAINALGLFRRDRATGARTASQGSTE